MKLRAIKARNTRRARTIKTIVAVVKTVLFPVYRKKDNALVDTVASEAAATALILKAKAAKKASLYIGTPYTA